MELQLVSDVLVFLQTNPVVWVLSLMNVWLLYLLIKWQAKHLEGNDKYVDLITDHIKIQQEQIHILKAQNEKIKEIFVHIVQNKTWK